VKQACVDKENQHENHTCSSHTSELQESENIAENINTAKR